MTTLYLMRHGSAVAHAATDAERPLSDQGRAEVAAMVPHLLAKPPALVWVSPYLRAQQTAAIVLSGLQAAGIRPQLETVAGITPDDNPFAAVDMLASASQSPLLVVTHNPFVSVLVSLLSEGHSQARLGMATASIGCLSGDVVGMGTLTLEWYQRPGN